MSKIPIKILESDYILQYNSRNITKQYQKAKNLLLLWNVYQTRIIVYQLINVSFLYTTNTNI